MVNLKTNIKYIIIQIIIIITFFVFILGANTKNIFYPWTYAGDALYKYQQVQNIKESGWLYTNDRLAAPFTANNLDIATFCTENITNIFLKIFLLLSGNIYFSVNLFFLINCIMISVITYLVFISLKVDPIISLSASLTYALLPYLFLRFIHHLSLSTYLFVPLSILLCIWLYSDDNFFVIKQQFFTYKRNILALLFCVLIGSNGISYYPFFTCFFFIVTMLIKIEIKNIKKCLPALSLIALIIIVLLLNLMPHLLYSLFNGRNLEANVRDYTGIELFALKISQLFIPLKSFNIDFLQTIISRSRQSILINENISSYLGLYASIGCILLLIYLFIKRIKGSNNFIFLLSRLNIAAILYAVVGGFSAIFAYLITPSLRGANRISVFIAFISILAFSLILNDLLDKWSNKTSIIIKCSIFVCAVLGILLQYPHNISNKYLQNIHEKVIPSFNSDAEFINTIERSMPNKSMIYQLPFHRYPEMGNRNKMDVYAPFIGNLHSKELRWSFGSVKGRYPDYWHQRIDNLPLDNKLFILSIVGFEGVFIDRRAYTPVELSVLEQSLSNILNVSGIYSNDDNLSFFSMYYYNNLTRAKFNNNELDIIRNNILENIDEVISANFDFMLNKAPSFFDTSLGIGEEALYKGIWKDNWFSQNSNVFLSKGIKQKNGMMIKISINYPWFVYNNNKEFKLDVIINDEYIKNFTLLSAGTYDLVIEPELLPDNNIYKIELAANGYFIPAKMPEIYTNSNDVRELSFLLHYIGDVINMKNIDAFLFYTEKIAYKAPSYIDAYTDNGSEAIIDGSWVDESNDYYWCSQNFAAILSCGTKNTDGIMIKIGIIKPWFIFNNDKEFVLDLIINNTHVKKFTLTEAKIYELFIEPEFLDMNDINIIELTANGYFIPKEMPDIYNNSNDSRQISFALYYIGDINSME